MLSACVLTRLPTHAKSAMLSDDRYDPCRSSNRIAAAPEDRHKQSYKDGSSKSERSFRFKKHQGGDLGPNIAAVYDMSIEEAKALGIPEYALPQLRDEPTLEEAREAHEKIQSIIASFMSADL